MHAPGHSINASVEVRRAAAADADAIAEIYNHYVRETIITFEEQPVSGVDMAARMREVAGNSLPWFVAEEDSSIVGFSYATQWKGRSAYRFSVETTVYLTPIYTGRGAGTKLSRTLIDELKQLRLHCAIGGIALPNAASIALHEKLGFRKIGHFVEVGFKFDRWLDVGYWQLQLSDTTQHAAQLSK